MFENFTGATALTCEDCPGCDGVCYNTPDGQVCACADDKFGTNCDLCLIKPELTDGGNGYQYLKTIEVYNYISAQLFCDRNGGHLAIYGPRDPIWLAVNSAAFGGTYVGLTDRDTEGTFYWNDGALADEVYTPWLPSQPDDLNNQDCALLRTDGFLTDEACTILSRALCEIPIDYPARVPKFIAKNNCEYFIIPPAFQHVSEILCEQKGGVLAVDAINNGNNLKKLLHHFTQNGQIQTGVFTGFEKVGTNFLADGVAIDVSGPAAEWSPGHPGDVSDSCVMAKLTPDWFDYGWLEDVSCHQLLPGLCEVCRSIAPSNEQTCKSGKVCTMENTICVVHEGSCFEECVCAKGYIFDPANSICVQDNACNSVTCGLNACCVFDSNLNRPTCRCEGDYLPSGPNEGDDCSYPSCTTPNCGSNAICVRNVDTYQDECICLDNHIPNPATAGACVQNPCATGGLNCGANTKCCITNPSTASGECLCDEGYYYVTGSTTECFDPCDNSLITCGTGAICVVDVSDISLPKGVCACPTNTITLTTAATGGCIIDKCSNGDYPCEPNSQCLVIDTTTGQQACVCKEGFYKITDTDESGCFDPCDGVSCTGASESCVIDFGGSTPTGVCVCNVNFIRNFDNNCVADVCATLSCTNGVCGFNNPPSFQQGCVCNRGYGFEISSTTVCEACPQTRWEFPNRSASDYILINDPAGLNQLSAITLCAWLTPPSGEDLTGHLFSYATSSSSNKFILNILSTEQTVFLHSSANGLERADFDLRISKRSHLCYVVARELYYVQLFLDGKLFDTVQYDSNESDPAETGQQAIIIGQDQDSIGGGFQANQAFKGTIENMLVYDRVLTREEIKTMAADSCSCITDYYLTLEESKVTSHGGVVQGTPVPCT
uniref:sushi, von Willebrand factor type A, EGF and pentraxin domain-containing protein 1-like n=1 Tax=Styela clava TaxID=7725 RepID=UPI00193A6D40|nr:sushi, von Willebrand factor type A, EGF and pentraxin domain-containing protein 1-like [Styela clava]